jgi:hypothetical protein
MGENHKVTPTGRAVISGMSCGELLFDRLSGAVSAVTVVRIPKTWARLLIVEAVLFITLAVIYFG